MAAKKYLGASWGGGVKRDFYPLMQKVGVIVISLVLVLYFLSMVVIPWSQGRSWGYVQDVWSQWQTFNAAMIALCASFVGLYAARRHAKKQEDLAEDQRRREFVASKAFLSSRLADLGDYFDAVAESYAERFEVLPPEGAFSDDAACFEGMAVPPLPDTHVEVFRSCIVHAPPPVADFMASVLSRLQIIHSRLRSLDRQAALQSKTKMVDGVIYLSECQALCNRMYSFARGEVDYLDVKPLGSAEVIAVLELRVHFWEAPGIRKAVFWRALDTFLPETDGSGGA